MCNNGTAIQKKEWTRFGDSCIFSHSEGVQESSASQRPCFIYQIHIQQQKNMDIGHFSDLNKIIIMEDNGGA